MTNKQKVKNVQRLLRARRVRMKITGTAKKPRAAVYRSLRHMYVQLIDDQAGKTLVTASDLDIKKTKGMDKTAIAVAIGKTLAQKAAAAKIKHVVYDRRSFKYHGRVKALAQAMRDNGLEF